CSCLMILFLAHKLTGAKQAFQILENVSPVAVAIGFKDLFIGSGRLRLILKSTMLTFFLMYIIELKVNDRDKA
ncbi:MAG: hypothetical protein E7J70_03560, partial [Veillonella sp.]|nr:hypothetical protein [Veillonella sp.]